MLARCSAVLGGALRCFAALCGADRCLLFFGQGYGASKLHAVDLHRYCVAHVSELQAVHDNMRPIDEALLDVVAMAAGGTEPSHIERDLQRYLDRHLPLKYPISSIPLRIKKPRWKEAATIDNPIIWPFDAAHAIASFSPDLFETLLGGSEQARFDWWSTQWDAAWVKRHPAFAGLSVGDSKNFIPYWLHGDDVAYSKHSKMCVISWGSRVGVESNIFLNRWPFIVLPYDWIIKDVTLNMVWHAFSLACQQLLKGVMPDSPLMGPEHKLHSWQSLVAGRQIAYGLKFAFSDMKCDMQFQMQTFDFRSYSANACCKDCFASKVDPVLNYMEVGFDAGWRCTYQSHEDWIFTRTHYRAAALDVPGMCKERVVDDWMHNGHLGIFPHVLGSVLDDLCTDLVFGEGPLHVKLTRAWNEFKAWCSRNDLNCSMPPFTPASLGCKKVGSGVKWRMLKTKAMNSRICMSWVAHISAMQSRGPGATAYQQQRATMMHHLASYQQLMDLQPEFLSEEIAGAMYTHGYEFLFQYCGIAAQNRAAGFPRYNFVVKFHRFCHMLDWLIEHEVNPKYYQCYHDEDYVGKMSKIASGTHRATMPLRVLQRLKVYQCMRIA